MRAEAASFPARVHMPRPRPRAQDDSLESTGRMPLITCLQEQSSGATQPCSFLYVLRAAAAGGELSSYNRVWLLKRSWPRAGKFADRRLPHVRSPGLRTLNKCSRKDGRCRRRKKAEAPRCRQAEELPTYLANSRELQLVNNSDAALLMIIHSEACIPDAQGHVTCSILRHIIMLIIVKIWVK